MNSERNAELLERVRERLASRSADPDAETIADAVRAESGGLLSDTDLLAALRYLQTELVGAGPLFSGVRRIRRAAPAKWWW